MSEVIERSESRGVRKRKGRWDDRSSSDWEILEQQPEKPRLEEFVKEYKELETGKKTAVLFGGGGGGAGRPSWEAASLWIDLDHHRQVRDIVKKRIPPLIEAVTHGQELLNPRILTLSNKGEGFTQSELEQAAANVANGITKIDELPPAKYYYVISNMLKDLIDSYHDVINKLRSLDNKIMDIESDLNQGGYIHWNRTHYYDRDIWYAIVPCICVPRFVQPPPFSYYGIPTKRQIIKIDPKTEKDSMCIHIHLVTGDGTKVTTTNEGFADFKRISDIVLFQAFVIGESKHPPPYCVLAKMNKSSNFVFVTNTVKVDPRVVWAWIEECPNRKKCF